MQRNNICFKEARFNFSNKTSLHFLHFACKVDQDKSWALHMCLMSFVLFIIDQCLGESQRMFRTVCSAHDMEGADKSCHRL